MRASSGSVGIFRVECVNLVRLTYGAYNSSMIVLTLAWIGTACWVACFWWMHRISSRQEAVLKELHEMTTRIEQLSKAEHDLIQEVHPKVSEIKEHVENVAEAVSPESSREKSSSH